MNNLADEQLAELYLKGNSQALEFLIRRYLRIIYNFVRAYVKSRDEAEEVTQEVFIKVWKNFSGFKPDYKFKPWLFAIAKHAALDHLKKKRPLALSDYGADRGDSVGIELADKSVSVLDRLIEAENFQKLDLAMSILPAGYRATLDLRYDQDLKFREIAEVLKEPLHTVKTRHRRALERLKKLLS